MSVRLVLLAIFLPLWSAAQAPPSPRVNYRVVSPTERPPVANPADGIALIEAPSASPLGGANLSYPIKLPPARKDHAPLLDLTYSSDHLHGWLGRGWDLSLPTIDVETRWGVPRYHADLETETYLLEGSMLAPVAHRGESRPRTAELSFNTRVESEFRRITRHGDSPRNYWWEVAYPDGLVEYYGGTPEGPVLTAQIRTPSGNTFSWALVRSTDAYGNRIDYHYQSQADNGRTSSGETGTNRYPNRITYNGFEGTAGDFEVRFLRDRQLDEARRPDVRMEFTGGFKLVTADLLRRIEVRFQGAMVRHYELDYQTGAFRQSLLTRIAEFGNDGSLLANHEMDYHGLPESFSAFGPEETWNTGDDDVEGNILSPIPGFTGEISALGGAGSTSRQIGSAVTVGP
ncbi:MAG: SpvB/TcaC N-terminal domain-containing protein, partial [Bacteroidota bacterium]